MNLFIDKKTLDLLKYFQLIYSLESKLRFLENR